VAAAPSGSASPDPDAKDPAQTPTPSTGWVGGIPAGRIFGVPLVVSPAWVLLVIAGMLIVPAGLRQHIKGLSTTGSVVAALGLILLIYGAVLAHEASHVIVAKTLNLKVGRVVLQLLGAQSEVLDEPQTPGRAFVIAAAGPMTSVFLAGIGAVVGARFATDSVGWVLAWSVAWINGLVAAFNLLPGLPLDGGQMLRAAIWHLTGDKLRALLIAGWIGRGVALALGVVGFVAPSVFASDSTFGALYLCFIAVFVWSNASISIAQARVGAAVPTLSVSKFVRPALTVEAQLPLAEAVRRARDIGARALVVVDGRDRWAGIVSEAAVQATPVERQPWMTVSDLARPVEAGLVLSANLGGEDLMTAIQRTPATEYLVADSDGLLRGVLARADLVAALRAAGIR